jgi:hypothetical protein
MKLKDERGKILPGVRFSKETEFKKGQVAVNKKWGSDICIIEGCNKKRPSGNRGMCNSHYMRWWRTGNPETPLVQPQGSALERFWFWTDKTDTCWNWKGALDKRGYGRHVDDSGWRDMAHRWSYKHFIGEIPDGLIVDHTCVNPKCVNPAHFRLGTHRQNIIEWGSTNAAFINSQKTHCSVGHELTAENIYTGKNKYGKTRVCKVCHKRRVKEYLQRKKNKK